MEVDLKETLRLVQGGLLDHRATWQNYLDSDPPWQKTAGLLVGPIVLTNVVFSLVFAKLMGGFYSYAYGSNIIVALVMGLIMSVAGMALGSFVLAFLAGNFGGKNSFSRALAAVSLAAIPGAVAGVVGALIPGLGFLVMLAGGIVSLVFLYKILPLALDIPEPKRTLHFVVSLVSMFVINAVVATVLGLGGPGQSASGYGVSNNSAESSTAGSGILGEIQRQSQLIEAASSATYEAPDSGKISEGQIQAYVKVKEKTRALHQQYAQKMQKLEAELENKDNPTAADISKVYAGLGSALGANNAELEIVTSGGGNWAEHQWVASSLRNAMIQQGDGSDALMHNYALYEKYSDVLED
jgi:hypothetical protein